MNIQIKPDVSIIIPVYNTEKYLNKCLDSIISQTFNNFECILVNDASTDNSAIILDKYTKKDKRLILINKKQNEGCPLARKTGLDYAKGKFILHIDSDDWIELDMVEKLYNKINMGYDMVYCDYYGYHKEIIKINNYEGIDKITLLKEWFAGNYPSSVINILVKKDIYKYICFPSCNYDEDCVITIQLIYYSEKIGYLDSTNPLYHTTLNDQSLVHYKERKIRNLHEQSVNMSLICSFLIKKYGDTIYLLEPGLSNRINSIRHSCLQIRELRNNNHELYNIYPQSKKYIFDSSYKSSLLGKLFLFFAMKNIKCQYLIIEYLRHIKNNFISSSKKEK